MRYETKIRVESLYVILKKGQLEVNIGILTYFALQNAYPEEHVKFHFWMIPKFTLRQTIFQNKAFCSFIYPMNIYWIPTMCQVPF